MRNVIAQMLPSHASMSLEIDPPMEDGERHFLVILSGHDDVVVRVIDSGLVSITNPVAMPVFFTFGITRLPTISPELKGALASIIQKVKSENLIAAIIEKVKL